MLSKLNKILSNLAQGMPIDNLNQGEIKILQEEYGHDWWQKLGFPKAPRYNYVCRSNSKRRGGLCRSKK